MIVVPGGARSPGCADCLLLGSTLTGHDHTGHHPPLAALCSALRPAAPAAPQPFSLRCCPQGWSTESQNMKFKDGGSWWCDNERCSSASKPVYEPAIFDPATGKL